MINHHEVVLVLVNEDVHVMNSIPMIDHKLRKLFDNKNVLNVQQYQCHLVTQVHVEV